LLPLIVGFLSAAGAWGILRSDVELFAASTLIKSLYPPTPEDVAQDSEKKLAAAKKGWRNIFGFVGAVLSLSSFDYFRFLAESSG
ncbi:MAG: hypothetical protein ACREIZ_01910, partial [Candidatus Methylomirabilales bacterium]